MNRSSLRGALVALAALSLLPLAACKSGSNAAKIERQRQWVELGLLADARLNSEEDGVKSGPGFYFQAGQNLAPGDSLLLPGIEGQINYSWQHADSPPQASNSVQLLRSSLGGRLAWNIPAFRLTPVVRGGGYYRWEFAGQPAAGAPPPGASVPSLQGSGWYAGVGLEFVPNTNALAHIFATAYTPGGASEPDEVVIGIGITSHF